MTIIRLSPDQDDASFLVPQFRTPQQVFADWVGRKNPNLQLGPHSCADHSRRKKQIEIILRIAAREKLNTSVSPIRLVRSPDLFNGEVRTVGACAQQLINLQARCCISVADGLINGMLMPPELAYLPHHSCIIPGTVILNSQRPGEKWYVLATINLSMQCWDFSLVHGDEPSFCSYLSFGPQFDSCQYFC